MNNTNKKSKVNRRQFLGATAGAVSAFTIVPRHVLGGPGKTPPSEKLNIAGIGVGGMGAGDINRFRDQNVIALCDVDWERAGRSFERFPNARRYKDFRKMLDKEKDIDAVVVATPDHTHAVAAMRAIKMGKHVYVEKPLAHEISEVRMLTEAARKAGVATQMGNQGRASQYMRLLREWIEDGAIGTIRKVETWTPHAVWPQGIDRPTDTPPVPETLDWDLWLGPAPKRPYHPAYAPSKWRGWWDFGTGALGDMGCHIFDPLFYALQLTHPTSVEATCSLFVPGAMNWDKNLNTDSYPRASIVRYKFPARGDYPELEVDWYDGGLMPKRPEELEEGRKMGSTWGGALFIGDKGKIICNSHGAGGARIIPDAKMKAYQRPPEKYPRSIGHAAEWVRACKGGEPAGSNFEYAGPLSETILLGNIAIRMLGKRIQWDPKAMKITNIPEANQYLQREYRDGWSL
jgi:predicted dehydrogenase